LSLTKFIQNDMTPFVIETLDRAIPSIWDGMKDSHRKCVFGAMLQTYNKNTGTKPLESVSGGIKAATEYHHGDLDATVTRLAQDFPGSNNINYFIPSGEFGSRKANGTDFAKARYLATGPEDICTFIFSNMDAPILERRISDDGKTKLEYVHYAPVVPMVLVNGCETGIATGWSTTVPCYNPLDLIKWVRGWLKGSPPKKPLKPWYRGFKGSIELQSRDHKPWNPSSSDPPAKWMARGILSRDTKSWDAPKVKEKGWVIEEIPIGTSIIKINQHIEFFMTGVKTMKSKAKAKAKVSKAKGASGQVTTRITPRLRDFRDYCKANEPRWELLPSKNFVPDIDTKGNFDVLKKSHPLTNMHLLNADGIPTKYSRPEDILEEWCPLRLGVYTKRKKWWLVSWGRDLQRQKQKYKFVKAVIDQKLDLHQKDEELEASMLELGLKKMVSDAKWKKSGEGEGDEDDEKDKVEEGSFDYLLSMQMRSMTVKKLGEIKKEIEKIQEKVDDYKSADEAELWERDLQEFEKAYTKFLKTRKDV